MVTDEQGAEKQSTMAFQALADDLRSSLIQIINQSQLAADDPVAGLQSVQQSARLSLDQIDAYLLSRQQVTLNLGAVPISAVLFDAAEQLRPLARELNAELATNVAGKYGPAMSHRVALQAALVTVGGVLLRQDASPRPRLQLSVYRTASGLAAGVFGQTREVNAKACRQVLLMQSQAFSQTNLGGLRIANDLMKLMSTQLRVVHRGNLTGLVACFQPSQQLQLV